MKKTNQPNQNQFVSRRPKLPNLTADLQRLQAEFINYKRRVEEERIKLVSNW